MIVSVGSQNPVKLSGTLDAFRQLHGDDVEVIGASVDSGEPSQPMTYREMLRGSRSRARASLAAVAGETRGMPDFGVGLEGGMAHIIDQWFCTGFATIVDRHGRSWSALCPGVAVPDNVVSLVVGGMELGDAQDKIFGLTGSKQDGGLIGIVTGGLIQRAETFRIAVLTALCSMQFDRDHSRS